MFQGNEKGTGSGSAGVSVADIACAVERQAFTQGYVAGVTAMMDGRGHALFPEATSQADTFRWLCRCGWVTYQYPAGVLQTPIADRLIAHVREAIAVDERTSTALDVDGCSCPPNLPDHRHELYFRRLDSTGQVADVVVNAVWLGGFMEVLCWPLSERGIALAQQWCDRHRTVWTHDRLPVAAGDLIRRGEGWLR